jgi:hypothetical protein
MICFARRHKCSTLIIIKYYICLNSTNLTWYSSWFYDILLFILYKMTLYIYTIYVHSREIWNLYVHARALETDRQANVLAWYSVGAHKCYGYGQCTFIVFIMPCEKLRFLPSLYGNKVHAKFYLVHD